MHVRRCWQGSNALWDAELSSHVRELLLLYADVLASPALESFTEISVVMAVGHTHTHPPSQTAAGVERATIFSCCSSSFSRWE